MRWIALCSLVWLAGCQELFVQPVPAVAPVVPESKYLSDQAPLPIAQVAPVERVYSAGGSDALSFAARKLAEQLSRGLSEARVKRLPLTLLPLGPLPEQPEVVLLGDRLSESLYYYLQSQQYNLIDYRVAGIPHRAVPDLSADELSGLKRRNRIYFVLVGNYARYSAGYVINARVLDTTTRQVLAAGQVHIPDQTLEAEFPGYDPLGSGQRGMIIETRTGPGGIR